MLNNLNFNSNRTLKLHEACALLSKLGNSNVYIKIIVNPIEVDKKTKAKHDKTILQNH